MTSYGEALCILKSEVRSVNGEVVEIELKNSVGEILASSLKAQEMVPPFNNSAMDGFAVRSIDCVGRPLPIQMPVTGCVAAGDRPKALSPGAQAIEIMTGAPMPSADYDTVIRIEDVKVTRDALGAAQGIRIDQIPQTGANVRLAGEDFKIGQVVLNKGVEIKAQHLLALAGLGFYRVPVSKKPTIAILSTGKELVPVDTSPLEFGQIRNSTGLYLWSELKQSGYPVLEMGVAQDSIDDYLRAVKLAFTQGAEILISTGAVSMGQFDFVYPALERLGAVVHFHKCAIRPGKPILFASLTYEGIKRFIFGLPGNPVSTAVGLKFFVEPFLAARISKNSNPSTKAVLTTDVRKPQGLKCFFKAELLGAEPVQRVNVLKGQASFMVSPLLHANAWAVLPEERELIRQGEEVDVWPM